MLFNMKDYYLTFILITQYLFAFAQGFDNTMLFGYSGGNQSQIDDKFCINILTFSEGSLNVAEEQYNSTDFNGTDAAISDSSGQLQFYFNGVDIFDKTYAELQNGGLINEYSSFGYNLPQGGIIIPLPDKPNQYVLFSLDEEWIEFPDQWILGGGTTCSYTIVDMALNNGLGMVTERKIPIIVDTLEYGKLSVVRHANGRDWWLIVPELRTNRFYTVLIDPQGVHYVGIQSNGIKREYPGTGQANFSPDGTKYVMQNAIGGWVGYYVDVYSFDRCEGIFSNHEQIHFVDTLARGFAIAPNSRWLYISARDKLFQYDLWSDSIGLSGKLIDTYEPFNDPFPTTFFRPFLAPDNKIYINTSSSSRTLHVIHRPDEEGVNCAFEQQGIRLPCNIAGSLPTFANYRLGPIDGSACDSLGIDNNPVSWWRYTQDSTQTELFEFTELAYHEPTSWQWDFGDGSKSQDKSPFHTYTQSGVYNVCLTVCNANACDTLCREVTVGVIGVEETANTHTNMIITYPNPAQDYLKLLIPTPNNTSSIAGTWSAYTINGQEIATGALSGSETKISTQTWADGVYVLYITLDGVRSVAKVVVSRL
jgi:hypothetical protein